jgi:hypothetical protein
MGSQGCKVNFKKVESGFAGMKTGPSVASTDIGGLHIDGLQPLPRPIAALQTPWWLIAHPELKEATRVKGRIAGSR